MLSNSIYPLLIFFPLYMYFGIFIAKKLKIVDKPNKRKIHKVEVVNLSGILIYSYLCLVTLNNEYISLIKEIIIIGLAVIIIGFIDDRREVNPITKLTLLFFPSCYLILNGFKITNLGNYEYIDFIELGEFSLIFTLLAVMLLINAINYLDGTDGLLTGYTITAFSYFYFLSDKQAQYADIFLIFSYILFISLIFNFLPSSSNCKSFLGDSGSLFIGFFLSFTIIFLYKYKNIHPAFLIWSCWLPVYDFIHVTFNRLITKTNFLKPDRSHFHHIILKFFSNSHYKTFLLINFLNFAIIFIGYVVCLKIGKIYSLTLFVIFFVFFTLIKIRLRKLI